MDRAESPSEKLVLEFKEDTALTEVSFTLDTTTRQVQNGDKWCKKIKIKLL